MTDRKINLIIANGVFKSGSTWVRDIILHAIPRHSKVPEEFQYRNLSSWIDPSKLNEIVNYSTISDDLYISKGHIFKPSLIHQLAQYTNVKIIITHRDLGDSIVSAFYHFKRQHAKWISFRLYYWLVGRYKAYEMHLYLFNWQKVSNKNVYYVSYELLKKDIRSEIVKLCVFLDISLTPSQLDQVIHSTDFNVVLDARNQLNVDATKRSVRKGKTGEFVKYTNVSISKDIQSIIQGKFGIVSKFIHTLMFVLRRYFFVER
jgi:hypothetical protein